MPPKNRVFVTILLCAGFVLTTTLLRAQDAPRLTVTTPATLAEGPPTLVRTPEDDHHTAWVVEALKRLQTIKPGMTRADLLNICTTEGGLATTTRRIYIYRKCFYVKVDVSFKPVDTEERPAESPKDIITSISKPYLEWMIFD